MRGAAMAGTKEGQELTTTATIRWAEIGPSTMPYHSRDWELCKRDQFMGQHSIELFLGRHAGGRSDGNGTVKFGAAGVTELSVLLDCVLLLAADKE